MPKRILILTAGFGEGHNAAARGIEAGLAATGREAAVERHDLFAETYGLVNDWARGGYLTMINRTPRLWLQMYERIDRRDGVNRRFPLLFQLRRRLKQLLERFRPDVVVSVYPAYPHLLAEIVGDAPAPFRRVVYITDSITVNTIWFRVAADYFFVPNEQTAAVLKTKGVPNEQVRVTGFPVAPLFARLGQLRQPPSPEYGRRLLYMLNPGRVVVPEIINRLAKITDSRLTVTVGHDQRLRRAVEAVVRTAGRKFEIVGWSDQLPRLMLESHLLISKAGGATVQEAIAARCPMIINQVVPGQEAGNARLLETTGAGVIATTPDAIIAAVERVFADDARVWREWSENIGRLTRPEAPLEIAKQIMALAEELSSLSCHPERSEGPGELTGRSLTK
ncbi:MAG TPA: glycosyltransferase [Chthoniobacterales bacterium]|jgi:processive 1,2-diacylglycerol beta-glucosyltransferase